VAHTGGPGGTGGYAELAAVDVANCAAVPEGVDLSDATAVLHDGTTALRILEKTGVDPGEWALVLGAAGGMGMLLVQLLVKRGALVVGAARGRAKLELVSEAGAHSVIDYAMPDWTEAVLDATRGQRPTIVLDGVGGNLGGEAFGLIADGGRFSAHGAPSGSFAPINRDAALGRRVAVTTIADLQYGDGDRSRLLDAALGEVKSGRVGPVVGQTFSLAEASKAHLGIEARETVAKTLLVTDR
jgi:NADPH2:quinone reductase